MSIKILSPVEACCADLYARPAVAWLLGESFHPGGLALTECLGRLLNLVPSDLVLDVACGSGSSAMFLTRQFGCRTMGVDFAPLLVSRACAVASRERIDGLLDFALGDVEVLPFQDASFDAVVSECAISTFLDKDAAAREMARILKPRGRLGFSDVVLTRGEVPEELRGWLFRAACVAGACSAKKYREIFASAGFSGWREELYPEVLATLLGQVRARLLALEIAGGLRKLDLSGFDLASAKQILGEVEEWVKSRSVSYGVFSAVKEAWHV